MQRDMDLVRQILFKIEASPDPELHEMPVISGAEQRVVANHLTLLKEAGLIDAYVTNHMGQHFPTFRLIRLTWPGHEFLDNARDDTTWNKAKSIAGKLGGVSFGVLVHVLTGVIDARLKAAGFTS